jgi:hypothetical protein
MPDIPCTAIDLSYIISLMLTLTHNAITMSSKRLETKVFFTPEEREQLDTEAARLLIPRGQLIRERALRGGSTSRPTPRAYARAVENAARVVSGVPRPHLEAIVASVVTTLAQSNAA